MTITKAKKRCSELQKQISIIQEKYYMSDDFVSRWDKEKEIKPLHDEWCKLSMQITKAENTTNIELTKQK